jgi:hypothetical protein
MTGAPTNNTGNGAIGRGSISDVKKRGSTFIQAAQIAEKIV